MLHDLSALARRPVGCSSRKAQLAPLSHVGVTVAVGSRVGAQYQVASASRPQSGDLRGVKGCGRVVSVLVCCRRGVVNLHSLPPGKDRHYRYRLCRRPCGYYHRLQGSGFTRIIYSARCYIFLGNQGECISLRHCGIRPRQNVRAVLTVL
jgi:hypothetical protein